MARIMNANLTNPAINRRQFVTQLSGGAATVGLASRVFAAEKSKTEDI